MQRGPYDVWAPRPQRVRLVVDGETREMTQGDGGWWTPAQAVPDTGTGVGGP